MGNNKKTTLTAAAYLKNHTSQLHQQTESVAYGQEIMNQSLKPESYHDLIRKNYYIHRHLDDSSSKALGKCDIVELFPLFRSRTLLLYQDMELLLLSPPSYNYQPPEYHNDSELLGGLYVLLGSALGGRVIHRALTQNSNLSSISHFYFFADGQQALVSDWPKFCRLLDQYLETEDQRKIAGQAAKNTFQFFHQVYSSK